MKKQLLKSLKNLRINLKDKHLESNFDAIESAINELAEESVSTATQFDLPADISLKDGGYVVFSDGACRGNPGPGAWAYVIQDSNSSLIHEEANFSENTTNNKMELLGAIEGLQYVLDQFPFSVSQTVYLVSDSKYVVDGITKWVSGWKRKGWKKADNKTPENVDLWRRFDQLVEHFEKIHFKWVKGHSGHPQNERCDQLANESLDNAGC